MNNNHNNTSPSSSKNSSSDSLNYILRKDSLTEANSTNMVNTNSEFSNLTKKKSLKTTLYRIFTQRKKTGFYYGAQWMRTTFIVTRITVTASYGVTFFVIGTRRGGVC
jgi:hypothetical protein